MNDDLEAMDGLCAKIIEQRDRIKALEAQIAADTICLKEGADIMVQATARIWALKAALRGILDQSHGAGGQLWSAIDAARAALAQEQDK